MAVGEASGLLSDLSGEVSAQLRASMVDIGYGRTRAMYDLILGWAAHVRRLKEERVASLLTNPSVWNEHDYVAALFIRDFVEAGLSLLDNSLVSVAQQLISRVDAEYMSFTQAGCRELLARVAQIDTANRGWWWDRMPTSGPVFDQLHGD
jgi:hypothetical protein